MHTTKIVDVDLQEVIEVNGEGFLDLLEELWMADYDEEPRGILADISYTAIGFNADNGCIQVEVTAEEEFFDADDADGDAS